MVLAAGLEGVVVAETELSDVRGGEGFYHYRQYSAVELAAKRSFEDVWQLMFDGELPGRASRAAFSLETRNLRSLSPRVASVLAAVAHDGSDLEVLRTAVSVLGAEAKWQPIFDTEPAELRDQALRVCSSFPTVLAAAHRLRIGEDAIEPRADLSLAANYLWMLFGEVPAEEIVRALEQYWILMVDHGLNASTFTARVITSTGADLASAICGAIGALSGPLHGGAPSRALDMLDAMGSPDQADAWARNALQRGQRIMGFGHRVYKTDDPRSLFLRDVARNLEAPLFEFAEQAEHTVQGILDELKPGRELHTNAEFYAGVTLDACGIPREMFTPTFACARVIGWSAHVLEQAAHNRLIRPSAVYVGPTPSAPVPSDDVM